MNYERNLQQINSLFGRIFIESTLFLSFKGVADCVMAVGFEKMERGSLGLKVSEKVS